MTRTSLFHTLLSPRQDASLVIAPDSEMAAAFADLGVAPKSDSVENKNEYEEDKVVVEAEADPEAVDRARADMVEDMTLAKEVSEGGGGEGGQRWRCVPYTFSLVIDNSGKQNLV